MMVLAADTELYETVLEIEEDEGVALAELLLTVEDTEGLALTELLD